MPKKVEPTNAKPSVAPANKSNAKPSAEARNYTDQSLKVLYGKSGGMCAYPACFAPCIETGPAVSKVVMKGQIAHIRGVKPGAPRHDPLMTPKERDDYPNLILLCNIHHPVIDEKIADGNPKYSIVVLEKWKQVIESYLVARCKKNMPEVTSAQMQVVTEHLLDKPIAPNADFSVTDPQKKMEINELTGYSGALLKIGLGKVGDVARFVESVSAISPMFPESLRAGFVKQYEYLWNQEYRGDNLFEALRLYSSGYAPDPHKEAAGLAVLAYYFERCEVFKKA